VRDNPRRDVEDGLVREVDRGTGSSWDITSNTPFQQQDRAGLEAGLPAVCGSVVGPWHQAWQQLRWRWQSIRQSHWTRVWRTAAGS